MEFIDAMNFGLLLVLCFGCGFNGVWLWRIDRVQARINKEQQSLEMRQIFVQGHLTGLHDAIHSRGGDWRQLPPEARAYLHKALRELLTEMDGDMPTRH